MNMALCARQLAWQVPKLQTPDLPSSVVQGVSDCASQVSWSSLQALQAPKQVRSLMHCFCKAGRWSVGWAGSQVWVC